MNYIGWATVAMFGYGVTAILLKVSLRHFPPEVALVITNTILVAVGLGLVFSRGESFVAHLSLGWPTAVIVLAGATLSVSIVSYYIALSRGPASVVVPIFAMNFAVASVMGVVLLGEDLRPTRIAGLLLASGAIVLLAR